MRRGCARGRRTTRRRCATGWRTDWPTARIEYLEALRWRGPALAAHLDAIGDVDVILAPASRVGAPTIDETDVGGGTECRGWWSR